MQLTSLRLRSTDVSGSVEPLAALTQLTYLGLHSTDVSGSVEPLAALTQLSRGCLWLGSTNAYGDATVLRAIPGLGSDWGPDCVTCSKDYSSWASFTFTPCSAFQGCGALFLAPIAVNHPCALSGSILT